MSDAAGRIDWEAVHRRLEESQRALDRALNTDADTLAAIYRERAARLASRRAQAAAPGTTLRVLVFSLGPELYALEFADLAELLPFGNCTPVPGGAPQLLGVINFHGEIRSVVDLGRLLDLPLREDSTGGYVLLLRKQGREVGLRVDGIDNIRLLDPQQLAAPSMEERGRGEEGEGATGAAFRYLRGLTPDRLRLLNTEAILAHPIYKGSH